MSRLLLRSHSAPAVCRGWGEAPPWVHGFHHRRFGSQCHLLVQKTALCLVLSCGPLASDLLWKPGRAGSCGSSRVHSSADPRPGSRCDVLLVFSSRQEHRHRPSCAALLTHWPSAGGCQEPCRSLGCEQDGVLARRGLPWSGVQHFLFTFSYFKRTCLNVSKNLLLTKAQLAQRTPPPV